MIAGKLGANTEKVNVKPQISNIPTQTKKPKVPRWIRPTFSPEHGVLLVLFGSFLTGAALAQQWTQTTTLALICAFFALQVEHPYIVQLKLRKNLKPRYLIWGGIYSSISVFLATCLWFKAPSLLWLYLLAIIALAADGIAVIKGKHKSRVNEMIGFAGICLAAPLAYGATTGSLNFEAIAPSSVASMGENLSTYGIPFGTTHCLALWILNTLFFSSAVYTIKLRRKKTSDFKPGIIYHGIAASIVAILYYFNYLSLVTALSFAIALIKFLTVLGFRDWYRQARFHSIAVFETRFAVVYIAIASISLLPAHLPIS